MGDAAAKGRSPARSAQDQLVSIGGRRLRITNLDKVLYPETGTTKGEVIDYYTRIGPTMIPHIIGRPITRKRWPDGVGTEQHPGQSFFAKDLEPGAPEWVRRLPIPHSGGPKDYPVAGDVPTLVYLAQVASLELHVPQWRFTPSGERGDADRLVLDLDPGPGVGLAECAEVARWAREILGHMGLDPFPVTSGSKGIQLYSALPPGQSSESASALAHELARAIEADHPDLVVSSMKKAIRGGRVLIDWSQNNGAKTTIAPYSLRGRAHPNVAAPRTWAELEDPDLSQLSFADVLERVERIGDPLSELGYHAGGRDADDGPLSTYIAKRTAGRTPEPVPSNPAAAATPPGELPRFVIQEHHASRLHWDFRLERDGVLVSWAVPRGVPHSYRRNNLAVMTEDHPMEYATFEGTIPAGEYGGGSVTIWDDGRYELEKWRDDEVIATLQGRPGGPLGRVRLALIRTEGQGEKSSWLLHRMKTDADGRAQPDGVPVEPSAQADEPRMPRSAAAGAPTSAKARRPARGSAAAEESGAAGTAESGAAGTSRAGPDTAVDASAGAASAGDLRARGERDAGESGAEMEEAQAGDPVVSGTATGGARARAEVEEAGTPGRPDAGRAASGNASKRVRALKDSGTHGGRDSGTAGPRTQSTDVALAWPPTAESLRPMLSTSATPERARLAARRWGDPAWAEAKWDGIRAVGVWDGASMRLYARSGNDITMKYPEVTEGDVDLGDEPAIVDGEIVALDERGRPSFPLLQTRMNLQRPGDVAREAKRTPVQYYLFDVLGAHGLDLTSLPLRQRRQILEELAGDVGAPIVVPPVFDDVDGALATSKRLDLEGVVVKDPASTYRGGIRTESWLKVKLTRTQEVVLAGLRPGQGGRAETFGSLLLGIPGPDGLQYAGRVGTGFSDSTLRALMRTMAPLHSDRNPLVGVPPLDARGVQWLRPELVGEVEFGEFTPGGILRHSRWRGLRPDKSADDVTRES